jgi:hypothetical protein
MEQLNRKECERPIRTKGMFEIAILYIINVILNQIVKHESFGNCVFKKCDLKTQKFCFFKSQVRWCFF